jgi:hypothetical protein
LEEDIDAVEADVQNEALEKVVKDHAEDVRADVQEDRADRADHAKDVRADVQEDQDHAKYVWFVHLQEQEE